MNLLKLLDRKQVYGVVIDDKINAQVMSMYELLRVKKVSLNAGGNTEYGALTGAYDLENISLHAGLSKEWQKLFTKEPPKPFVGFEIRF